MAGPGLLCQLMVGMDKFDMFGGTESVGNASHDKGAAEYRNGSCCKAILNDGKITA